MTPNMQTAAQLIGRAIRQPIFWRCPPDHCNAFLHATTALSGVLRTMGPGVVMPRVWKKPPRKVSAQGRRSC